MRRLFIRSSDKISASQSTSNFTINLQRPISGEYVFKGISLHTPIFNVYAGVNDAVYTSRGNFTLTPGAYSTSNIASTLQTAFRTVDAAFSVSYSTLTGLITVTLNQVFTLNWSQSTGSDAASFLGFTSGVDTASAMTATGTNAVDFYPIKNVFISFAEASFDLVSSHAQGCPRGSLIVPNAAAYGTYVPWSDVPKDQVVKFDRTKVLTITCFTDGLQSISNLFNGQHWTMLLEKIGDDDDEPME